MYFFVLFVLCVCLRLSSSYPTGAPPTVCDTMMPGHNVAAQKLPETHNLFQLSSQTYSPNSPITVKVTGTMVGLLLQARKNSDMLPVGSFSSLPAGTKQLTCQGMLNSVTHSAKTPTTDPTFTWNPPASDVGNVTFYLTMVQSYGTFWVKIPSQIITYSVTSNQIPTTTPEPQPETTPSSSQSKEPQPSPENSGSQMSSPVLFLMSLFLLYNIRTIFL